MVSETTLSTKLATASRRSETFAVIAFCRSPSAVISVEILFTRHSTELSTLKIASTSIALAGVGWVLVNISIA
jgi:hypothetical protein